MAASRHGADEDAGVGVMIHHPDAIAEDSAAGERAGRVDGENRYRLARAAVVRG